MERSNRNTVIAAAVVLGVFAVLAYMLPAIMLALADISPVAAGVFIILFLIGPFVVLWLRGRSQSKHQDKE